MNKKKNLIKEIIKAWEVIDIAMLSHDEEKVKEYQWIIRDLVIEYKKEYKKDLN